MSSTDLGTEPHPASYSAYRWLKGYMVLHPTQWLMHKEALASSALSGNRMAEVCMSTIERLANGESVGDRYILGLAWSIMKLNNYEATEAVETSAIDGANWKTEKEL